MDERRRRLSRIMACSGRITADAQQLNAMVRDAQDDISLVAARELVRACREAEGWLAGVRRVLLSAEEGPGPHDG